MVRLRWTGNPASMVRTSYRYDALNRPSGMTDSQGGAYTLSFDANDNAQSIDFPNGVTTSHTVDALHRLTLVDTSGSLSHVVAEIDGSEVQAS